MSSLVAVRRRRAPESFAAKVARWFAQGLLVFVPTVSTVYAVLLVLGYLDSAIGAPIPGLGLVLTLLLILFIGFLASHVVGQSLIGSAERALQRVPVISLLYSSIKDLLGAFVGDKKSFDQPAMITIDPQRTIRIFGFVTCQKFDDIRLRGYVAVYLPQAYNFAGNVILVPKDRIETVDADPAQFMAFILSGGVSQMSGAKTVLDSVEEDARASQTMIPR